MGRGICVGECLKISNILSAFIFFSTRCLPLSICSVIDFSELSAKSPLPPLEQKIHPPVAIFPSLFGQVKPAFILIL